ncbi:Armadillo repeat-containing protein [Thalictrum thalictroides]|uniref:Armadillo repeat-containing protein n=1 Tax=Thalictrum thalictroides TaxID=46969 RepID=A0A7J6WZW1_THATH|nr:Armadillo repeat-containing protein [Thalictrum thalictroides]
MGSSKNNNNVRTISQEAFEALVKENIEDLDLDPTEALQDAIETLTLQGVDLSGIVTCIPGVSSVNDNPVIQCLDRLKEFDLNESDMADLLDKLCDLCLDEGSGNKSIAIRNGGLDLVILICSKLKMKNGHERTLVSALKAMASLIYDLQSTEAFRMNDGPQIVVDILNSGRENIAILNSGFSVVTAAATGNELVKESFMELKVDELLVQILRGRNKDGIQHPYDAIRVLLTADDGRVLASQVFGYARRFAKIGIVEALVSALHEGINSPNLISASIALKAVAVNDEICMSIAEHGGIDAVLLCIDDSGEQNNKIVAKSCCTLLCKLAGSDANKSAIVQKKGMDRLIKLSCRFSDDPSVLQEIMSIICTLSLRSPGNAACAVEAGAGDLAIQAMQNFPTAREMQKQSCLMIRNLVVRNPENRTILLGNGIEKIIRKAKENHASCREAATDALRDLGLDNYNM